MTAPLPSCSTPMRLAKVVLALTLIGCAREEAPAARVQSTPRASATATVPTPTLSGNTVASAAPTAASAAVSEPTRAPYDLTRDVEERKARAMAELGERISIQIVREVFVVIGPLGQVTGAARTAELAIDAYLNGRFTQAPTHAISVYLFPSAKPYEAYCKQHWKAPCISGFGFYTHGERQIVLNVGPGVGTLTHELVHPLFEQDFPEAPIWFEEGVASLYEGFGLGKKGEIRGVKNWRLPTLIAAINNPKLRERAQLDGLFGMKDETFRGDFESLNYATARYFCLWLEQRKLLWEFYRKWRENFKTDVTGEQSFLAVSRQSPSEANSAFMRWLRTL